MIVLLRCHVQVNGGDNARPFFSALRPPYCSILHSSMSALMLSTYMIICRPLALLSIITNKQSFSTPVSLIRWPWNSNSLPYNRNHLPFYPKCLQHNLIGRSRSLWSLNFSPEPHFCCFYPCSFCFCLLSQPFNDMPHKTLQYSNFCRRAHFQVAQYVLDFSKITFTQCYSGSHLCITSSILMYQASQVFKTCLIIVPLMLTWVPNLPFLFVVLIHDDDDPLIRSSPVPQSFLSPTLAHLLPVTHSFHPSLTRHLCCVKPSLLPGSHISCPLHAG